MSSLEFSIWLRDRVQVAGLTKYVTSYPGELMCLATCDLQPVTCGRRESSERQPHNDRVVIAGAFLRRELGR